MTAVFFDPQDYLERDPATARDELEASRLRREASQRARLCEAMTRRAAEVGFEAASAAATFEAAGLGSGTFYKLFDDRQECLAEAFERCAEMLLARVARVAEGTGGECPERLEAGLGELLELLAANPDVAQLLLVEIRAGDARCREAQQGWLGRFAGLLASGRRGTSEPRSTSLARLAAGAIENLLMLGLGTQEAAPERVGLKDLVWVGLLAQRETAAEAGGAAEAVEDIGTLAAAEERRRAARKRQRRKRRQREQLLAAMTAIVGTKGYRATRVADILKRTGLSRPQFYESFASKEECLLAAFDAASSPILERVEAALNGVARPAEATVAGLAALLAALAERPAATRLVAIEVRTVGERGEQRFEEVLTGVSGAICTAMGQGKTREDLATGLAASVAEAIAREVGEGRAAQLQELLPELVFTALAPCLGGESAAARARALGGP